MNKILISGGSGLIGNRLSFLLNSKGYEVSHLSRTRNSKNCYPTFLWNIDSGYIDKSAFKDVSHIIHLSGAGVADKRWSNKRKNEILNSRVDSTNLLYNSVKKLKIPLKSFIAASATGYYGSITTDKIFKESDNAGNDFLGEVCKKWENAAHQFKNKTTKVGILRTGIVLSKNGGALEKMKTPIVSPLGSGKQYMPWIHIDDLCYMYIHLIEQNKYGIYNAVGPEHHTNKTFSKLLANAINRPFIGIGVPSFMLKLIFGNMSKILLEGSKISSKKIEKNGYSFRFNSLSSALKDVS